VSRVSRFSIFRSHTGSWFQEFL